ncbi:MAG: archease [Desulfobacterales bacterium]|nr:archease [Desulfobacterales bacterium]MBF0395490.1 archease [Desulfobacterales bacterium]
MTYRLFDHTADFGMEIFGKDLKDLFCNAQYALFDQITELASIKNENKKEIKVIGADLPDLMINWLRELLYLWNGKELLVNKTEVIYIKDNEMLAVVYYVSYDPDQHLIKKEIKAVTYHQIEVLKISSGYRARVIFDL